MLGESVSREVPKGILGDGHIFLIIDVPSGFQARHTVSQGSAR